MDSNILDTILVVSLSLMAVSSLIFLVYFIPVLIQLAKTLEALRELTGYFRDYVKGITSELGKAFGMAENALGGILGIFANSNITGVLEGLSAGLEEFFSERKR